MMPLKVVERAEGVTRNTPFADLPELLRVEEAAAYLDIGRGHCYDMVRRGDLPSVRLGRLVRVKRDGLLKKVEQGR